MSSADPGKKNRRIHPRKPARSKTKVTCRKGSLDLGANLAVKLLDVSESGLRLLVKAEFQPGEEVSLNLEGPLHLRPLAYLGQVVWTIPTADGQFCIGIRLDKFLKYQDLQMLT